MNKKMFINITTGEVIYKRTKWGARRYFKADGKACGYPYSKRHVVTAQTFVAGVLNILDGIQAEEEEADGIA